MQKNNNERLVEIDGLKGIAAIVIVALHYSSFASRFSSGVGLPFENLLYPIYIYGYLCVDMFFILSGFLMAKAYEHKIEQYTFCSFMKKRMKKLVILSWGGTTWAIINEIVSRTILNIGGFSEVPINVYTVLCNYFCINGSFVESFNSFNGPAWFICQLIICYAMFYCFRKKYSENGFMISCIIAIFCGYTVFKLKLCIPFLWENDGRGVMTFFLGCILFYFNKRVNVKKIRLLVVISIIIIVLTIVYGNVRVFGDGGDQMRLVWMLFIFPIFIIYSINEPFVKIILSAKPFLKLGKLSTYVFIFHWCVFESAIIIVKACGSEIDFSKLITLILFYIAILGISKVSCIIEGFLSL